MRLVGAIGRLLEIGRDGVQRRHHFLERGGLLAGAARQVVGAGRNLVRARARRLGRPQDRAHDIFQARHGGVEIVLQLPEFRRELRGQPIVELPAGQPLEPVGHRRHHHAALLLGGLLHGLVVQPLLFGQPTLRRRLDFGLAARDRVLEHREGARHAADLVIGARGRHLDGQVARRQPVQRLGDAHDRRDNAAPGQHRQRHRKQDARAKQRDHDVLGQIGLVMRFLRVNVGALGHPVGNSLQHGFKLRELLREHRQPGMGGGRIRPGKRDDLLRGLEIGRHRADRRQHVGLQLVVRHGRDIGFQVAIELRRMFLEFLLDLVERHAQRRVGRQQRRHHVAAHGVMRHVGLHMCPQDRGGLDRPFEAAPQRKGDPHSRAGTRGADRQGGKRGKQDFAID